MTTLNGLNNYLEQQQQLINNQTNQLIHINNFNSINNANKNSNEPSVEIVEQPARSGLRFRYRCEGRSAGSLLGVNSRNDKKTYPAIRINNYRGKALIIVSCVTNKRPYRAHPHYLVGKDQHLNNEGNGNGIIQVLFSNSQMKYQFESLGIRCVRKKDIVDSLKLRESLKIDPFNAGFSHVNELTTIDLNAVRLCFQVYIEDKNSEIKVPLEPVVSDVIFDKKSLPDLCINKIKPEYASVSSQEEIIMLCSSIMKGNIEVRFWEEQNGIVVWESNPVITPKNIHKKTAICFNVPKYHLEHINGPVECFVQLRRKTDNQVSEPKRFYYFPNAVFQSINLMFNCLKSPNQQFIKDNNLVVSSLPCNLVQNNLAINSLTNLGLVTNGCFQSKFTGNSFSIQNLQSTTPPASTSNQGNCKKRNKSIVESEQQQQAISLARKNRLNNLNNLNKINSIMINSSIDNQMIINKINQAKHDNLQINRNIISLPNSMSSTNNSSYATNSNCSFSSSSFNASNPEQSIEPYIDFSKRLQQPNSKTDSNHRTNIVQINSDPSDFNLSTIMIDNNNLISLNANSTSKN